MGNGVGKLNLCFSGDAGEISRRRHDITVYLSHPLDEGLGHSFCYFHPSQLTSSDDSTAPTITTAFKSISGASLSANTSTPLSVDLCSYSSLNCSLDKASSFESSDSFAAIPLQPVPRNLISTVRSGPIPSSPGVVSGSGPIERGFLSGPIERSFISGPLENHNYDQFQRYKPTSRKWNLIKNFRRTVTNSIKGVVSAKFTDSATGLGKNNENFCVINNNNNNLSSQASLAGDGDELPENSLNVQWAQGKAGEDRVHIVTSEEHGWVFVGIYDGFNGPDATDYLLHNLYSNVHKELKGLLWNDSVLVTQNHEHHLFDNCPQSSGKENCACQHGNSEKESDLQRAKKQKKWKNSDGVVGANHHNDVLKALSEALRKTEESFLEIADLMLMENPELSLMGSCVLVMLMKGEDVYLMNVGDSRAVLAQKDEPELRRINEETGNNEVEDEFDNLMKLTSVQLTMDHSTSVEEEVRRIKKEHQDDSTAISNDRVKGSLKVTRAFGAGFLKQPKWNNALLKMFRIDYIGSSPYISCSPSVYHHKLVPKDKFLILSSDGLYQYFTNEEAISEVDKFISRFPEGDPAQHLIEEVLFRAANKAGMDFHELLDIPQGDRRRYHDDVSIIIISFEGRIWRSSM